jgi:secreted trypsin-like serine protease
MKSYTLVFGLIFSAAIHITSVAPKSSANPGRRWKIIDGTDAKPGEFPWQVTIQFYLNESDSSEEFEPHWEHKCGGTLIDHRHVITAAHCTRLCWPEWLQKTRIVFGAWNLSDETESSRLIRTPCHYSIHPNYSEKTGPINMDIAVVTWKKPITYSKYIQPLRLAPANSDPLGTVCLLSGWGIEHELEDDRDIIPGLGQYPDIVFPDILKVANQTIITNEECAQRMGSNSPTGRPILETDICGVDITGGNQTGCLGDSGSPVTCYDADGPYLAGIHVYGGCDMPKNVTETVNIRVSKFLDFISCKPARKG